MFLLPKALSMFAFSAETSVSTLQFATLEAAARQDRAPAQNETIPPSSPPCRPEPGA
jgi:hypothetical protein